MDSDDDSQLFSPPEEEPFSPVHARKLRRLKKVVGVSSDSVFDSPADNDLPMPPVDSFNSKALASSGALDFEESSEQLRSKSMPESIDGDSEGKDRSKALASSGALEFEESIEQLQSKSMPESIDSDSVDKDRSEAERSLGSDSVDENFEGREEDWAGAMRNENAALEINGSDKKSRKSEVLIENKEKNKRVKRDGGDEKPKPFASSKRRAEKERKAYLQELHSESQRLLRETRDAAFKPIPVVQKPISSVLEKIRQRKREVSKKTVVLGDRCSTEENGSLRDIMVDSDPQVPSSVRENSDPAKVDNEERNVNPAHMKTGLGALQVDESSQSACHSSHENTPSEMNLDEESKHAFRAPIDDTQDLFGDSETCVTKDEVSTEQSPSPLEEVLAPSLLTMQLKLDYAPTDDVSSGEDNDKENVHPHPFGLVHSCSSPTCDPVKAFVDDEAVEEDDSDNDLLRFQENEDEDNEDNEDLKDMIATGYEEKQIDNERRNLLHQQWLEQQDAVGTEDLLHKLNCVPKRSESALFEEDEDLEEVEEDFSDEDTEDIFATNAARINSRKVKQMIPLMFSDKDDAYLSSDDEGMAERLAKQRLIEKAGEQATFLSPADDESSREIFGLIKKLNIVPNTGKKSKTSSYFNRLVTAGSSNSFPKSSFLGRASNHSLPSSHKKGSKVARSFIFERDDSNSQSAMSMSEDSSDKNPREHQPRNASAKFTNSQSKSSSQDPKIGTKTISGTSLFEILQRSSVQSNKCIQDNMVSLSETVFSTFKCTKKSIKTERR